MTFSRRVFLGMLAAVAAVPQRLFATSKPRIAADEILARAPVSGRFTIIREAFDATDCTWHYTLRDDSGTEVSFSTREPIGEPGEEFRLTYPSYS